MYTPGAIHEVCASFGNRAQHLAAKLQWWMSQAASPATTKGLTCTAGGICACASCWKKPTTREHAVQLRAQCTSIGCRVVCLSVSAFMSVCLSVRTVLCACAMSCVCLCLRLCPCVCLCVPCCVRVCQVVCCTSLVWQRVFWIHLSAKAWAAGMPAETSRQHHAE